MIPDTKQRQQAVAAAGHAFVWASAGTGKTHTLTLRALFLLLHAPFDPRAKGTDCAALYSSSARADRLRAARAVIRRFVLTTFTRKAAAEMQTRLYQYLDLLASADSPELLEAEVAKMNHGHGDEQFVEVIEQARAQVGDFGRLRAGAEALAELATELQVCTLHSYAATILQRHPIEAGIPPTAQFADEEDTTAPDVPALVVEGWWQQVQADTKLESDLRALLELVPLADLTEWLRQIFAHPWIVDELEFGKPDERKARALVKACTALVPALAGVDGRAKRVIAAGVSLGEIVARIDRNEPLAWTGLCQFVRETHEVLFDSAKRTQAATGAIGTLGADAEWFNDYNATYQLALQKSLAEEHAEAWERWRRFTARFAAWADGAAVRELGLVTFDDMLRLAARLLGTNDNVRHEERERLWGLLVDEFQDTDPTQLELLTHILRRRDGKDHEVVGFFVGDSKQSIYRFRRADLPAIEAFVKDYSKTVARPQEAIGQFNLTASFRTLPPITSFVNEFFSGHLPLPGYAGQELSPVREPKGKPAAPEWRLLHGAGEKIAAGVGRDYLAWEVARLVEEYVNGSGGDPKSYNDVVVLVATHMELDALLPVLEAAGIPVVSSGAKRFYAQPEVLDVLSLLIALHNPQDSLAVGAILRSPLVGLSDAQIFALLERVKTRELIHKSAAWPEGLPGSGRARLDELRRLAGARTDTAFAGWLRQVRQFIPAGVYAQQDVEGRVVVRIDNVLDAFRQTVTAGLIPPLQWLLDQRARADRSDAYDADLGEDVSVTDESVPAVRAMTIHKAKGLEGKFVIVYGWQHVLDGCEPAKSTSDEPLLLTQRGGGRERGFQLAWGPLQIVSPRFAAANDLNRELDAEEGRRLAYVAATRARDRLVLLSPHIKEVADGCLAAEQEALKPLLEDGEGAAGVYEGKLRVSFFGPAEGAGRKRGQAAVIKDAAGYAKLWNERAKQMERKAAEALIHKPSQPETPEESDDAELDDYVREKIEAGRAMAMAAGTLAHHYLERHLTDESFESEKLKALATASSPPASEKSIEKATAALKSFFGSPYHKRARQAKILAREMPLYLSADGKPWSGVMDLVIDEDGVVMGVDYKVMAKPSVLPDEYRQQERIYTEALNRLFPSRKVKFEFWWLK